MQYRPLGQSGIQASVVGLGTWAIGGFSWGGTDEAESINAIRAAIDAGITLIDSAPAYGLGDAESFVGKAIEGRRDEVILATKCGLVWHTNEGQYFFDESGKPVHRYLGPESIRHELEESLKRFRTDRIDLYQTHWQDPTTPIEDTMGALMQLKKEGKIRAIGVSNASRDQLKEYQQYGPVDSDQEKYSMLDRGVESELLPYCRENGIAFLAYSPLALGLLTGRIGVEREFPDDDWRSQDPRFSIENRRKILSMLDMFRPIADAHNLTIAQLVIAWTISQPGITHALVGARNVGQAQENARAGDVILSQEELTKMDEAVSKYLLETGPIG